jgi:predicted DNA-binding transcriptional regulator YafY
MEILILIGVGWLVYIFFLKNSNQGSSSQNLNDIAKTSYSSDRQKSSRKSNSSYEKEPNAVLIQRAIDSGRPLKFRYVDQDGEITERTVTPEHIERRHDAQVQCLVAHCHLRDASRTFVIRRMQNIRVE